MSVYNLSPTSPFLRASPQDILRSCILLYPVAPVQAAQCRSIPCPEALSGGATAPALKRSNSVAVSGGYGEAQEDTLREEIAQKTAFGVHIRLLRGSAGRRIVQKIGGSKESSWL